MHYIPSALQVLKVMAQQLYGDPIWIQALETYIKCIQTSFCMFILELLGM